VSERWHILYRGPLSSCNYGCGYCPFAKRANTAAELRDDVAKLNRFVDWIASREDREIGVLFTPWGEALIHPGYQDALRRLSEMPHVYRAAIQTNLSGRLDWLAHCDLQTVALWCTWHPSQINLDRFLKQCRQLDLLGVRYSVGVVGLKENLTCALELREQLAPSTYLWINAYKDEPDYYSEADILAFEAIDPLFRQNTHFYPSLGKACSGGHTSFTVDGDGHARRCHFIESPIGNIYEDGPDFDSRLRPSPCTRAACECHIGYIHMKDLGLERVYGEGLLERIPRDWNPQVTASA